jgi:hypothetical protein
VATVITGGGNEEEILGHKVVEVTRIQVTGITVTINRMRNTISTTSLIQNFLSVGIVFLGIIQISTVARMEENPFLRISVHHNTHSVLVTDTADILNILHLIRGSPQSQTL